jgi:hypothetical protein
MIFKDSTAFFGKYPRCAVRSGIEAGRARTELVTTGGITVAWMVFPGAKKRMRQTTHPFGRLSRWR